MIPKIIHVASQSKVHNLMTWSLVSVRKYLESRFQLNNPSLVILELKLWNFMILASLRGKLSNSRKAVKMIQIFKRLRLY